MIRIADDNPAERALRCAAVFIVSSFHKYLRTLEVGFSERCDAGDLMLPSHQLSRSALSLTKCI